MRYEVECLGQKYAMDTSLILLNALIVLQGKPGGKFTNSKRGY